MNERLKSESESCLEAKGLREFGDIKGTQDSGSLRGLDVKGLRAGGGDVLESSQGSV